MPRLIYILLLLMFAVSCRNIKQVDYLEASDFPYDAINIAITDFAKTPMGKDKNVVAVHVYMYNEESNDAMFSVAFLPQYKGEDVDKYPLDTLRAKNGTCDEWLPSECIEKYNKLFFWANPNVPINSTTTELLIKYDQVYQPGEIMVIQTDGERWVYYFCKNNHRRYKKKKFFYGGNPPCMRCK